MIQHQTTYSHHHTHGSETDVANWKPAYKDWTTTARGIKACADWRETRGGYLIAFGGNWNVPNRAQRRARHGFAR